MMFTLRVSTFISSPLAIAATLLFSSILQIAQAEDKLGCR